MSYSKKALFKTWSVKDIGLLKSRKAPHNPL